MVVIGGDERANGNEAVSAGTVLHDDRLPPVFAQALRQQPGANIDAAAGSERDEDLDGMLRPALRAGRHRHRDKQGEQAESETECETLHGDEGCLP